MTRLIVAIIGENVADFLPLCLDSIENYADKILFIDGGSKDGTLKVLEERGFTPNLLDKKILIRRRFEHEHKGANGRARNAYLDILRNYYQGDYCLVLDPDEIVHNAEKLKEVIAKMEAEKVYCANLKMKHLVYSLGFEDNTLPEHFVPTRLFKISKDIYYDEAEHVTLKGYTEAININDILVWHLSYSRAMFGLRDKYKNHLAKSNIHNKEFLRRWYLAHLSGTYPIKQLSLAELSPIIKKHFLIENVDEEIYFERRKQVEPKHFLMVKQWNDYFKPKDVLDVGCGVGLFMFVWNWLGTRVRGLEKSNYAIETTPFAELKGKIFQHDLEKDSVKNLDADLVTVLDVLEHLEKDKLQFALKNIYKSGNRFLFSIPFLGDKNLLLDKSHKIFEAREWWIEQLSLAGFKIRVAPESFAFKEQLLIGEK